MENFIQQPGDENSIIKAAYSLKKVIYPFTKWLSVLSMVASLVMMGLVTADVFLRRAFNSPIMGSYEVGKEILVLVVFFSVAYIMSIKGHVIVDTITRMYPKKLGRIISILALFLSLLIIALLSWRSIVYAISEMKNGDTTALLGIPQFPFVFVVGFGYAVLFLVIVVQFLEEIGGLFKRGTA